MEFREFTGADIEQAAALLARRHQRERLAFPTLQGAYEDAARTAEILGGLWEEEFALGVSAYEGDELQGFLLSAIDSNPVLGRHAMVSYEGLALAAAQPAELYRQLYAAIAPRWVENGALDHYVYVPAGRRETVEAWLRLGFALQQVYGVTALSRAPLALPAGVTLRQADGSDAQALRDVSSLIYAHQAGAPTYAAALPERMEEIREGYAGLPEEENTVVLLAYRDGKLAGFQCGNMEECDESMMIPQKAFEISICATVPAYRRGGVAHLLTRRMMNEAVGRGFENAIADWRITNLDSSNFWPQEGFRPVAYRMFRAIDPRVYWARSKV